MTTAKSKPHYVAHYLQIGSVRCASPLLKQEGKGQYRLERFEGEEIASTIFISGTLRLVNQLYGVEPYERDSSIEQLGQLIALYDDWELQLPEEV